MKRGLLILLLALAASAAAFVITRNQCECSVTTHATTPDGGSLLPELEWLRNEFKLTDEQFAKVQEQHLAYRPTCEALCKKVVTAQKSVHALAHAQNIASPELAAALQEQAAVRVECQKAMLQHLQKTAAVMSPEQARQYLDTMVRQVIGSESEHQPGGH